MELVVCVLSWVLPTYTMMWWVEVDAAGEGWRWVGVVGEVGVSRNGVPYDPKGPWEVHQVFLRAWINAPGEF